MSSDTTTTPKIEFGAYKINIDGEWSLEDLYVFPRAYEQAYFLLNSLHVERDDETLERVHHAYSTFPWYGGYSAVNFYNELKWTTPVKKRPRIISIKYSSPGWLELNLIVAYADAIAHLVRIISGAVTSIAGAVASVTLAYNAIKKGMQERELLNLKEKSAILELKGAEVKYIEQCLATLSRLLGVKNITNLNKRTGHPYITLKILMSFYRRLAILSKYERRGKVSFAANHKTIKKRGYSRRNKSGRH